MKEEMIDVVDEEDRFVRRATRKEVRGKALLCRSSDVIVFNSKVELFVQKRAANKELWPSMYAVGVGETVRAGESYDEAAARGIKEEIGVDAKPQPLFAMKFRSKEDNENMMVYKCVIEGKVRFADGEVSEGFFVSERELKRLMKEGNFTPATVAVMENYWKRTGHLIDIVDENDKVIKTVTWREMHENALLHRVANVMVFNSKGELFVHKRSYNLPLHPGMYDAKFGGIVDSGEGYRECAIRELKEEAGIENAELEYLFDYKLRSDAVNTNAKVYKVVYDGSLKLQKEEIEEGRFMRMEEVLNMVEEGRMTPSVKIVIEKYTRMNQGGKM